MEPLKILFATRNPGKAREVRKILENLPVEIITLADVPDAPAVVEGAGRFEDNALKKARALANWWQGLTLADDSGLEVEALGGAPGVCSARYAGEGASDEDNNRKLLEALEGTPPDERTARFVCVMALVSPAGKKWVVEGTCDGRIAESPRGEAGFGYDPLFLVPEMSKTFAELPPSVKNRISHRANALKKLRTVIEQIMRGESP
jgi:XTP/dITP diphosphohydrolase